MKVYYFTVIAVGLMFTFYLAGIGTGTSQILSAIGTGNINWQNSSLWVTIIATLVAFAATVAISIGGYAINKTTEAIMAGFILLIYSMFIGDLISIVNYMYSLTCPLLDCVIRDLTWQYWLTWAIIIPVVVGYSLSLVEFIRGGD